MGGGCFPAFLAVNVASLNAAEGNFWVTVTHGAFEGSCGGFFPWDNVKVFLIRV